MQIKRKLKVLKYIQGYIHHIFAIELQTNVQYGNRVIFVLFLKNI